MRLSQDKVRRLAERIHDDMEERKLLAYNDARDSKAGGGRARRVKEI